jgi:hypothetical protein
MTVCHVIEKIYLTIRFWAGTSAAYRVLGTFGTFEGQRGIETA